MEQFDITKIPSPNQEECYSRAYLSIVSAMAGFNFNKPDKDYGVDANIRAVGKRINGGVYETSFCIDFQLKATIKWQYTSDNHISYSLRVDNYNDLLQRRKDGGYPLLLGLLCLPRHGNFHPHVFPDFLVLQHAMYWYTPPQGATYSQNSTSTTIYIPKENLLTPKALYDLMQTYQKKGGI